MGPQPEPVPAKAECWGDSVGPIHTVHQKHGHASEGWHPICFSFQKGMAFYGSSFLALSLLNSGTSSSRRAMAAVSVIPAWSRVAKLVMDC